MAWEEATYIINKLKGTLTPMITSLEENIKKSVSDTMDNAINNVLVPKLPNNRDPLQFSTVQQRLTNSVFSTDEAFNFAKAHFYQTSGAYQSPVIGYYSYYIRADAVQHGETINGKGKIVTSDYLVYAQIDGGPVIPINAIEKVISGTHWFETNLIELTFSKSIRVYSSNWEFAGQSPLPSSLDFVGNSDIFVHTNSTSQQRVNYAQQAYNRAIEEVKKGFNSSSVSNNIGSGWRKTYFLYLT